MALFHALFKRVSMAGKEQNGLSFVNIILIFNKKYFL